MHIKVLNHAGVGTCDIVSNGITWAVDHGAKVINLPAPHSCPVPLAIPYLFCYHIRV